MRNEQNKGNDISTQDLVYSILEVKYVKAMGREVSKDPKANKDLYPSGWFYNGNILKKAEILAEAIKKKCLIVDTESYAEIEEGVKKDKEIGEER